MLMKVMPVMEFFLRKNSKVRKYVQEDVHPCVIRNNEKSIYKCQTLSEWFKNMVNPCATWLNILIQSLYIKRKILVLFC